MRAQITELAVELDGKREQLAPLEQVEVELERMCLEAGVGGEDDKVAPSAKPAPDRAPGPPGGTAPVATAAAPTRCDQIVALISQDPGRPWRPRDVACGLKDENVKSVRSLLQYLAAKGRLRKNPDASYQLPATIAGEVRAGEGVGAGVGSPAHASPDGPLSDGGREEAAGSVASPAFGRVHPLRPTVRGAESSAGSSGVKEQVLRFLREHANRRWRPRELALEMQLTAPDEVKDILQDLADRGVVSRQNYGRFQYVAPDTSVERAM